MSLARWHSLLQQYTALKTLQDHVHVVYNLQSNKPRYRIVDPRAFQAWAESLPGYDGVDMQRLELLIFQDITRT